MYYRNANCAVVVYDITQTASLEKARSWIRELQRQADPNIVIALCGNKSDLSARRQVSQEEAQKYAQEEGLMWGETSAKTGEGVSDIFVSIGQSALFAPSYLVAHSVAAKKLPLSSPASARGGARAGGPAAPGNAAVNLNKQSGAATGNDQCAC